MNNFNLNRTKLLFFFTAGIVGLAGLIVCWYQTYAFLESTTFCTALCHIEMHPQASAYYNSPHSEIACQSCHIGESGDEFIKSKLSGGLEMLALVTNSYERPIESSFEKLLPSSDTCLHCHSPEKFSDDVLKIYQTYASDEQNTEKIEYMVFKVGTGDEEIANNIHWHIDAKLYYVSVDEQRSEIAWVGIIGDEFGYAEYINLEYADRIDEYKAQEKHLMDCVDCHNRVGHIFYSPEELLDFALYQGKIEKTLPYIKLWGMEALQASGDSLDDVEVAIRSIKQKYAEIYPDVFAAKEAVIDRAIEKLAEIARQTLFPTMQVSWNTYVDESVCGRPEQENAEPIGCFRCHGVLVADGWLASSHGQQVCVDGCNNICHYNLYTEEVNLDDDVDTPSIIDRGIG